MIHQPIDNFDKALQRLSAYYMYSRDEYTLENMRAMMSYLGDPQDKIKIVHVAGTSGKTSTAYYMSALLAAAGKKTGLTVSPHVDRINERLQINNVPLAEEEFCWALAEFLDLIEKSGLKPSWFEVVVAFVYWYFAKAGVDYAVVEVGLGGLKDGTNVISRADKICIITDIGFDHVDILGETLADIAAQKIGIAQKKNIIFSYRQASEIMAVFDEYCRKQAAVLNVLTEPDRQHDFLYRNWNLARQVYEFIAQRDGLKKLTAQQLKTTQEIRIPGRMEIISRAGKTLIMDGAHNKQKMSAFLDSYKSLYGGRSKPAMLMSLKEGKDFNDLAELLQPVVSRIILTTFRAKQDVPSASMDLQVLAGVLRGQGIEAEIIPDQHAAYQALIEGPEDICLIAGSFYLLGQIRNNEHLA